MLNFAVGPVLMDEETLAIGAEQIPYFRTPEFSATMLENERIMKTLFGADEKARVVFLTSSGTGAMEASVINSFTPADRLLVVRGGSFGARFCQICEVHGIPYTPIALKVGESLKPEHLAPFEGAGYTGFLVNLCETSTGVLYDINLIGDFCRRNGIFLVVDAVSAFLADGFDMVRNNIDIVLTGAQKALALPPGLSVLALGPRALDRISGMKVPSLYFNLADYLKDGERGQTPYTPAVGVLLQMHARLVKMMAAGVDSEHRKIAAVAADFRERIRPFPFRIASESLSNAVTPLEPRAGVSAHGIFEILKNEYNLYVCPNGGELKDRLFRVGHIGCLTKEDNGVLIEALADMQKRGLL